MITLLVGADGGNFDARSGGGDATA